MQRNLLNLFVFIVLLLLGMFLTLSYGLVNWHTKNFFVSLYELPNRSSFAQIIWNIRVPRLIIGVLSGGLFALAGNIFQIVYRNKIASPDILGINALAIFSILVFSLIWPRTDLILLYALIGTAAGFGVILLLSGVRKLAVSARLIVIGLALSLVFRALSQLILLKANQNQQSLLFFLNGSLANTSWQNLIICFGPAIVLVIIAFLFSRNLSLMQLPNDVAKSLGINLYQWQLIYIAIALLMSAVAVSLSGSLGFIGLIAPNLARAIAGSVRAPRVLLFSVLIGACLTIFADLVGKIFVYPNEIPAGLLMIFIGTPVFIYLLKSMNWSFKNE